MATYRWNRYTVNTTAPYQTGPTSTTYTFRDGSQERTYHTNSIRYTEGSSSYNLANAEMWMSGISLVTSFIRYSYATSMSGQSVVQGSNHYVLGSVQSITGTPEAMTAVVNAQLYRIMGGTSSRGSAAGSVTSDTRNAYPDNGVSGGYWYVYAGVDNANPTLTVATTDNRTLYENDQFAVTGQVTDTDVGNVVTVKFSINGSTERAITANISQGTALTYNKVLTFKQGKLFDGANAITDVLADGSQHVLRVWAEDDKGGKSAEQIRVFYVVANRSAVLTINPVASQSDLIDADSITFNGNVSDPDGNNVSVKYKIGNGSQTEVYNGGGGAFSFTVKLSNLQTGVNTITVQATDSYNLTTTKTLRVTKSENAKPLLKSVATYKLIPPNGAADGVVLWIQRETGDLTVDAEISMGANGAAEDFKPMIKVSTAYVSDTIEEDEFTFDNGEVAVENIIVRLTMTRTSATSDKAIKLISGVLS